MGGERWLLLKSVKEAERLSAYLAPLKGHLSTSNDNGVWFDWHGKRRLEVCYQANIMCTEVAEIACREICRRFGIQRIGASSVGWYLDTDWKRDPTEHPKCARARYGGYTKWVSWMKEYNIGFSPYFTRYPEDYPLADWVSLEDAVREQFHQLDKDFA